MFALFWEFSGLNLKHEYETIHGLIFISNATLLLVFDFYKLCVRCRCCCECDSGVYWPPLTFYFFYKYLSGMLPNVGLYMRNSKCQYTLALTGKWNVCVTDNMLVQHHEISQSQMYKNYTELTKKCIFHRCMLNILYFLIVQHTSAICK